MSCFYFDVYFDVIYERTLILFRCDSISASQFQFQFWTNNKLVMMTSITFFSILQSWIQVSLHPNWELVEDCATTINWIRYCRTQTLQTYDTSYQPSFDLGSISPTHCRKVQMRRCAEGAQSLVQSVSPTKLHPTLPVHTTRRYAQLLCCKLWSVHQ